MSLLFIQFSYRIQKIPFLLNELQILQCGGRPAFRVLLVLCLKIASQQYPTCLSILGTQRHEHRVIVGSKIGSTCCSAVA